MVNSATSLQIAAAMLLAVALPASLACGGYEVTSFQLTPCKGSLMQFVGYSATLRQEGEKCMLEFSGHVQVTKDFTTAELQYSMKKGLVTVMKGTRDLCKDLATTQGNSSPLVAATGLSGCPTKAGKLYPKTTDISEHQSMMSMMTGKWTISMEVQHDSGKSCANINFELKKVSGGK